MNGFIIGGCLRLAVVLRADIGPAMCLLHMLLAIAFAFAFIRARVILAFEHRWCDRVLVVDMTVTLLFGRPSVGMVLAA